MTLRLLWLALDHWHRLDGWGTSQGLDVTELPLPRFVNLTRWWAVQGSEKQADVDRFEASLWQPPRGAAPAGPWSPEAENRAFAGLKAALGQ